jgi:spore coat protein CotF
MYLTIRSHDNEYLVSSSYSNSNIISLPPINCYLPSLAYPLLNPSIQKMTSTNEPAKDEKKENEEEDENDAVIDRELLDFLKEGIKEYIVYLKEENKFLREEVKELREEVKEMREKISELKKKK